MYIRSRPRRALVALAAATVVTTLLAPAASAAADCTWQLEHLPIQEGMGSNNLRINGVDAQGDVAGFYVPTTNDHTLARWTGTSVEVVPRPEGVKAFVTRASNASGVVAAIADRTDGSSVAMTHTPGVGYRELPTPAGQVVSGVEDINGRGDVVGRVRPVGSWSGGIVLWRADGSAPEVIYPAEAPSANPIALGEDGTLLLDSFRGVWLWRNGVLTKVPDLGHSEDPRALTRDGVIFSSPYGSTVSSWKWTEATGAVEKFDVDGVVEAVNEDGLAIGYLAEAGYTAVAWQGTKFVTELPLPMSEFSGSAAAVSDNGVIAGFAGRKPVRWTCR